MHRNLYCLIVDDEAPSRLIVGRNLDLLGVDYDSVGTGLEAIEKLTANKYDFVLMDINMPGADGMDSVKWIREAGNEYNRNIPIFALTSYSGEQFTKDIMESGMSEHMTKPFDQELFKKLIKKHFDINL